MATRSSLLPGKSHGQRSLVGCSAWSCKELDNSATKQWVSESMNECQGQSSDVSEVGRNVFLWLCSLPSASLPLTL